MQRTVRIASHALALVLISCLAGIAETSSAHLAKGSDKLRNGDISGAESELRQAVSHENQHRDRRYRGGRLASDQVVQREEI